MTAQALFLVLGKSNLALAAAILTAMLLRRPARQLFGAGLAYSLWLVPPLAAIGALLPARAVVTRLIAEPAFVPTQVASAVPTLAPAALPSRLSPVPVPHLDPWLLAEAAWLAGVAVMALWLAVNQRRFLAQAARARPGRPWPGFSSLASSSRPISPAGFRLANRR